MRMNAKMGRPLLLVASAVVLALAGTSAMARGYGDESYARYDSRTGEEVEVIVPRHYERSTIGAPIRNVSISRAVPFDDLDLRTAWGARELRQRVAYTARTLCNRLDFMYPVKAEGSPSCYRPTLDEAMAQANEAIHQARYAQAD